MPTNITPLPTAPNRNDPSTFASRADAWVAAIGTWTTEVNTVAGEVNTNASNASTSASTASTQANNASSSATLANQWATLTSGPVSGGEYSAKYHAQAAAASAVTAINAPGTTATSTTSNTIGTGSKSFTIQTGKAFVAGQWVTIADTAAPSTNNMLGIITAHDSGTGTLTVNVDSSIGSGTVTSWSIGLSAPGGVSLNGTQVLTNKTISYASNTLTGVQPTLVSGTNIKTINGASVLGSGDIVTSGGAVEWLSRVTASNSATVDVEWTNSTAYDEIIIIAHSIKAATDGGLSMQFKLGGSYLTSNYDRSMIYNGYGSGTASGNSIQAQSEVSFTANNLSSSAGDSMYLFIRVPSPASSDKKIIDYRTIYSAAGVGGFYQIQGYATNSSTSAFTGIRVYRSSGLIASGTFDVYGVKHA